MGNIDELYGSLRQQPFPNLGKRVGNFPLYDSLLAGCAERASRGELIPKSEIPIPDEETARFVSDLRQKPATSGEEHAFLVYFNLLEQIRLSLYRQSI